MGVKAGRQSPGGAAPCRLVNMSISRPTRVKIRRTCHLFSTAGKVLLKVFTETGLRFVRSDGFRIASSLSFQTLVTIVPASLFVLWSIHVIHPDLGMSKISDMVRPFFFPNILQEVTETIASIIEQINFAAIGWIGAAAAFTATFMLSLNVKTAFDRIFNINETRLPIIKRLVIATVVVIIFPLYVWVTFRETRLIFHLPSGLTLLRPYLVTILTLYLLYRFLPEQPPRTWGALLGSILAGIFLETERLGLAMYFSYMQGVYRIIYGTLFLLPLFLLWLYLSWVIILTGATFSSVIEKMIYEESKKK